MGLGVEKRMALLSGWIEERATQNGFPLAAVQAFWESREKRWDVRLWDPCSDDEFPLKASHGSLVNAMRALWTATQKRWPNAVTVRVPLVCEPPSSEQMANVARGSMVAWHFTLRRLRSVAWWVEFWRKVKNRETDTGMRHWR